MDNTGLHRDFMGLKVIVRDYMGLRQDYMGLQGQSGNSNFKKMQGYIPVFPVKYYIFAG